MKNIIIPLLSLALLITATSCNRQMVGQTGTGSAGDLSQEEGKTDESQSTSTSIEWTLGGPKLRWNGTDYFIDETVREKPLTLPAGYSSVGKLHDVDTLEVKEGEGYMVGEGAEVFSKEGENRIYITDSKGYVAFAPEKSK